MAIDRTKKWRCQWQGSNGWANMLEIIPAGEPIAAASWSVASFSRASFEVDFAEFGFEDLPIGMMKAPAASFSFVWGNLPSGLKELLKSPRFTPTSYGQETTTLFVYYNDEGTNTLKLQYIGAQANTLGNSFTYKDGVHSCQIETFDLFKTILDTTKTDLIYWRESANDRSILFTSYADYITPNKVERILDYSFGGLHAKYDLPKEYFSYLYYSFEKLRTLIGSMLDSAMFYWCRTSDGLSECVQSGTLNNSVTFYAPLNNSDYDKGSALDEDELLIMGHVCTYDGSLYRSVGGFFSSDKDGITEFDSMSTFLAALAGNLNLKFEFTPAVQDVSGVDMLTYNLYWSKPLQSKGTPVTLEAQITDGTYDITTAEKVFLIAECEIKNMAGDNINQARVSRTVSDKNDTASAQMVLHNLPTIPENSQAVITSQAISTATGEYGEIGVYQEKIYWKNGEYCQRVHTSVSINDGVNTHTLDSPLPEPTEYNLANSIGWAVSMQQTQGLPQAIAEYVTTYWGKHDQAMREFPCKMVTAEIMPLQIGDLFSLGAITEIGVNSSSVLLAGKPDWDKGIMGCKFLSMGS